MYQEGMARTSSQSPLFTFQQQRQIFRSLTRTLPALTNE